MAAKDHEVFSAVPRLPAWSLLAQLRERECTPLPVPAFAALRQARGSPTHSCGSEHNPSDSHLRKDFMILTRFKCKLLSVIRLQILAGEMGFGTVNPKSDIDNLQFMIPPGINVYFNFSGPTRTSTISPPNISSASVTRGCFKAFCC